MCTTFWLEKVPYLELCSCLLFIVEPASQGVTKSTKRLRVTVNLATHQSWLFGDSDTPDFDEDKFELPKWALLKDKVC